MKTPRVKRVWPLSACLYIDRTKRVYISGKVTHSVLTFLARESIDIDPLFEYTDLPAEFLRDPSCWLEAPKVEAFLGFLEQRFADLFPSESLIENVAHKNNKLKTWGVLDSVLKMMLDPQDIFMQPQRFISYFVSPAPPILNVERTTFKISFEIPISNIEYPLLTSYLKSIMEVLPCFMGKTFASATWDKNQVTVDWSSQQENLFASEESLNFNPDNIKNLVSELESKSRELSSQIELGRLKEHEIKKLKKTIANLHNEGPSSAHQQLQQAGVPSLDEFENFVNAPLSNIQTQIFKLSDYLTRAQQLITLLVGQNRLDKQVKEAMKRVDWEYVRSRFTHTVQDGVNNIDSIRREIESLKNQYNEVDLGEEMIRAELDSVIDRAVAEMSMKLKNRQIYIDRMLFFGREIFINKQNLKTFFHKVLDFVTEQILDKGYIRVMSRPRPQFAEVEIVDNGSGINKQKLEQFMKDPFIMSVLSEHKSIMQLTKSSPEGSTLLIQIPSIGVLDVQSKTNSSQRDLRQ